MKQTHRHKGNGLRYHFDGSQWWYLSPSYNEWRKAEFVVESKMVEL